MIMIEKTSITPGPHMKGVLTRFFGGVHPFRDAFPSEEFIVVVTSQDWARAVRGNPTCCALAIAGERMLNRQVGEPGLAIMHTIAYVAMPEPLSPTAWVVLRYFVATTAHSMWDKLKDQDSMVVRLKAPSPTRTLEARRAQNRRSRAFKPRRPHKKSPHQVLVHVLPRGYETWWSAKAANKK